MQKPAGLHARFRSAPRRTLLLELAFLTPAFGLLALGGFEWGGYFWLQHRVQTAADRALAAAISAPDIGLRQSLARTAAERVLADGVSDVSLSVGPGGPSLRLAYDASASPIFMIGRLIPLPSPVIVRLASAS
ncbi:MAG TPA: TadE/TadG family type IV pilus assembly protein [Phenylobacterium sp.]|nr:TadE/TadG family type IV pilus assembly protein [Phenylobacterium sp.]